VLRQQGDLEVAMDQAAKAQQRLSEEREFAEQLTDLEAELQKRQAAHEN
jgi:hypothetical protein